MISEVLQINSTNLIKTDDYIEADYNYQTSQVKRNSNGKILVSPTSVNLKIRTNIKLPKLGVMLVGWGGNNGSTLTAALEANRKKLEWTTRTGVQKSNWYGSITQSSTVFLGNDENGKDVYIPMNQLVPMISPDEIVVDGWDINSLNIGEAMKRAQVLDITLQDQIYKDLVKFRPRPSIYDSDFIAANQSDRADNTINGTRYEQYEQIRADIKEFKCSSNVDKIIILWTANTERFCDVRPGLNMTYDELIKSLKRNDPEISPSTIFAMAAIAEKCTYINGSPQNTFVPGVIDYAEKCGVHIAGDDFKSGQTKLKSVLVDFLVGAGIKPVSIVSYNHLGNNDGMNLSAPQTFRSKEISKSNVVDDMVESNNILYDKKEHPDHVVVIKYVPYVGDSKRAMDEYTSQIMMGGHNTLVIHNTCEDSLLATPLILDLIILGELCSRIFIKRKSNDKNGHNIMVTDDDGEKNEWKSFEPVLSILSYLCKAPLVPRGAQVVNSLFRQRSAIENILRACLGLPPNSNMLLEQRFPLDISEIKEPLRKKQKHMNGCTNGVNNI